MTTITHCSLHLTLIPSGQAYDLNRIKVEKSEGWTYWLWHKYAKKRIQYASSIALVTTSPCGSVTLAWLLWRPMKVALGHYPEMRIPSSLIRRNLCWGTMWGGEQMKRRRLQTHAGNCQSIYSTNLEWLWLVKTGESEAISHKKSLIVKNVYCLSTENVCVSAILVWSVCEE